MRRNDDEDEDAAGGEGKLLRNRLRLNMERHALRRATNSYFYDERHKTKNRIASGRQSCRFIAAVTRDKKWICPWARPRTTSNFNFPRATEPRSLRRRTNPNEFVANQGRRGGGREGGTGT